MVGGEGFVGRRAESAVLDDLLADAERGRPGAVLVVGEAGVGKTRLLAEFAGRAASLGVRVLGGGCVEMSRGGLPLGPFTEALRPVLREPSAAAGAPPELVAGLTELLLRDGGPDPPPHPASPGDLFRLVLDLLGALADARPLLLLLEDLHWADTTSVDLLSYLVHNLCQPPALIGGGVAERLLLVASYRPDEPGGGTAAQGGALVELQRRVSTRPLELERLSLDETGQLLCQVLGMPPEDAFLQAVYARSEGNAYIARELAREGAGARSGDLPSSLRTLFRGRVSGLSEDSRLVVHAVAVVGRPCPHDLLVEVCRLPEERLLDALRESVDRGLLVAVDEDSYAFRHALLRETAYGQILPGDRIRLHRLIADALSGVRGRTDAGQAAELAEHRIAARQRGPALVAALEAGRLAAELHAFAEAELWFTRTLELWSDVPDAAALCGSDRLAVAVEAAAAAHCAGSTAHAVALASDALHDTTAPSERALLWERLGRYSWEAGDADGALSADRSAVAELEGEPSSPLKARALAALGAGLMVVGELDRAAEVCQHAIELAVDVGADSARTYALTSRGVALAMRGHVEEGLACLHEAASAVQAGDLPDDVCRVYANLSYVLTNLGRLEDSLAETYRGIARARELGVDTSAGAGLLVNAADTLVLLGRCAEAEALVSGALQRDVPPLFAGHLRVTWAEVLIATGRFDEVEDVLREVEVSGTPALAAAREVAAAELAVWRHDWTTAQAAVDRGLATSESDPVLAVRLCALGARSAAEAFLTARVERHEDAMARARDRAAELLAAGASRAADEPDLPEVAAQLATCVAEAAVLSGQPSLQAWDAAVDAWRPTAHRPRLAYALWRQADALFAARRRRQGEHALRQAHALAEDLGAAPLLVEVERLAARVRLPLGRPVAATPHVPAPRSPALHLTPREHQVLSSVAAGRTNRQIARALFISEKTASVHVSNILAKLGATNRSEAAATAHALDLVPGWRDDVIGSTSRGSTP